MQMSPLPPAPYSQLQNQLEILYNKSGSGEAFNMKLQYWLVQSLFQAIKT